MSEFLNNAHLLRPWWLLALPILWLLIWRWRHHLGANPWSGVVDEALLPHLLDQASGPPKRWPLALASIATLLLVLALSGPAWRQLPQPVFSTPTHRVLVMDLSTPMNAADLKPSRLQRARLAAHQLIQQQREGDTALVTFAAQAYPVVPLSSDDATLAHLLDSLSTDLMPTQGQNMAAGIRSAMQLLDNAQAQHADIIVMTASPADAAARNAAEDALSRNWRTHVLVAGTEQGAPVPKAEGGWHKDGSGGIRLSRVDIGGLRELASAGGGQLARVERMPADWLDDSKPGWQNTSEQQRDEFRADVWQDEGYWLLLPLLLISAVAFRRGYLMALMLCILPFPQPVQAGWWETADQTAYERLQQGDSKTAAELFKSPDWKASALYQSGDFEAAAALWDEDGTVQDRYNRGNALARAGKLEEALKAYDAALADNPDFEDARFNRQLVEELLNQQQQEQQNQSGDSSENGEKSDSSESQDSDSQQDSQQQGEQSSESDGQNGDDQQPSESGQSGDPNNEPSDAQDAQNQSPQDDSETGDESEQDAQQASQDQSDGEGAENSEQAQLGEPGEPTDEQAQAVQQWLNRVPDDPGRLLRNKFLRMQERRRQSGKDESW